MRTIWILAGLAFLLGVACSVWQPEHTTVYVALAMLPVALATNVAAHRRRAQRRADVTDSVEYQAAQTASAAAFRASLILVSLLAAILGWVVGGVAAVWWALGCVVMMVGLFWARYWLELSRLRG